MKGHVTLVGAGPGDPELLTIKGMKAIRNADVIVYDYLADISLLDYAKSDSERIYVGKSASNHTMQQSEINQLLQDKAEDGKKVVRLKGGDPYLFGRGGEEAHHLAKLNIPFTVIPGIPAAIGAASYSGLPLTHRNFSSVVTFVTGHEKDDNESGKIDWQRLAQLRGTLVIYMGMKNLRTISNSLISGGMSAETPVAVIEWATKNSQKKIISSLDKISIETERNGLSHPAIIIIGDVVNMSSSLDWFAKLPLSGKVIATTGSKESGSRLNTLLGAMGAEVMDLSVISIQPHESNDYHAIFERLSDCKWLVFTSTNGVEIFFSCLFNMKHDIRKLNGCKIAAIGSSTCEALKKFYISPDFIPQIFTAKDLAASLPISKGDNIFLARSDIGSTDLRNILESRGAVVHEAALYKTVRKSIDLDLLIRKQPHAITFASSSAVRFFTEKITIKTLTDKIPDCLFFSIGPETSTEMKRAGLPIHGEAAIHNFETLSQTIVNYYSGAPK